ncbi:MAG: hypothetical protein R3328_00240 [Planococcaceae bacterium]|nr:hypothetical protein [Planococcaceae bacterium]
MKYFVSYSYSSGNVGGFGDAELIMETPMNTTSSLKESRKCIERLLTKDKVLNAKVVILNFIKLEEDNIEEESSINREY